MFRREGHALISQTPVGCITFDCGLKPREAWHEPKWYISITVIESFIWSSLSSFPSLLLEKSKLSRYVSHTFWSSYSVVLAVFLTHVCILKRTQKVEVPSFLKNNIYSLFQSDASITFWFKHLISLSSNSQDDTLKWHILKLVEEVEKRDNS